MKMYVIKYDMDIYAGHNDMMVKDIQAVILI